MLAFSTLRGGYWKLICKRRHVRFWIGSAGYSSQTDAVGTLDANVSMIILFSGYEGVWRSQIAKKWASPQRWLGRFTGWYWFNSPLWQRRSCAIATKAPQEPFEAHQQLCLLQAFGKIACMWSPVLSKSELPFFSIGTVPLDAER